MSSEQSVEGPDPILWRWVLAIVSAVLLPLALFQFLWISAWTLDAASPWAWLAISPIPIACLLALCVRGRRRKNAMRVVCVGAAIHGAAIAAVSPAWGWPSIATTWLLLDIMVVLSAARLSTGSRPASALALASLFWIGCIFGVGVPLAVANAVIVIGRAEKVAGERPYRIQYASQSDPLTYEPALALFDLSALKMQSRLTYGRESFVFQNHAQIVIGNEAPKIVNWSYGMEDFDLKDADHTTARTEWVRPFIHCSPQLHYAKQLPLFRRQP
jgi:hypothetical protein